MLIPGRGVQLRVMVEAAINVQTRLFDGTICSERQSQQVLQSSITVQRQDGLMTFPIINQHWLSKYVLRTTLFIDCFSRDTRNSTKTLIR